MPNASSFATPAVAPEKTAKQQSPYAFAPYALESSVRRELLSEEGLCFSRLVVRRTPEGVCLEGVLELDDCAAEADLMSAALRVVGVGTVQNNLVTRTAAKARLKSKK